MVIMVILIITIMVMIITNFIRPASPPGQPPHRLAAFSFNSMPSLNLGQACLEMIFICKFEDIDKVKIIQFHYYDLPEAISRCPSSP